MPGYRPWLSSPHVSILSTLKGWAPAPSQPLEQRIRLLSGSFPKFVPSHPTFSLLLPTTLGLPESPTRHHSLILPNPSLSTQRNGSVIDECKHCPEKIIKIHRACAASAVGVASAASVISEIINDCACLISLEVSGAGNAGCRCLCPRGTSRVFL